MAAPASKKRPTLDRAEPFPVLARKALEKYMLDHGEDMDTLLWSALMLDYELIVNRAERMANRPRLSRPSDDINTLNAFLPARFFELQDQMSAAVVDMARAGRVKDDAAIGKSYARMAETCIACHSLYLRAPRQPAK
jgi:hypothetical protein